MKKFLHVGCGPTNKHNLKGFKDWQEVRFDINPNVSPDIVGTLTDMSAVKDASVDAIYSSHNIEHLFPHEVPFAVREFHRVLKEDGFVVITCPDLQSVAAEVAKGKLLEPLYESASGPISAIDIIFGHREPLEKGNFYMAHKTGFTFPMLTKIFGDAGFAECFGASVPAVYAIWMIVFKNPPSEEIFMEMVKKYLP